MSAPRALLTSCFHDLEPDNPNDNYARIVYDDFWYYAKSLQHFGRNRNIIPLSYEFVTRKFQEFDLWSNPESEYFSPRCRLVYSQFGFKLYSNAHSYSLRKNDCIPIPTNLETCPVEKAWVIIDFPETKETRRYQLDFDPHSITPGHWALFPFTAPEAVIADNYDPYRWPNCVYESTTNGTNTLRYLRILRDLSDCPLIAGCRGPAPEGFDPDLMVQRCSKPDLVNMREFMLYGWEDAAELRRHNSQMLQYMHRLAAQSLPDLADCATGYEEFHYGHARLVHFAFRRWIEIDRPEEPYELPPSDTDVRTISASTPLVSEHEFYLREADLPTRSNHYFIDFNSGDLCGQITFTAREVTSHERMLGRARRELARELATFNSRSSVRRTFLKFPIAKPLPTAVPLTTEVPDEPIPPEPAVGSDLTASSHESRPRASKRRTQASKSKSRKSPAPSITSGTASTLAPGPPTYRLFQSALGEMYLGYSEYWDGVRMSAVPDHGRVRLNDVLHEPVLGPGGRTLSTRAPLLIQVGWIVAEEEPEPGSPDV